MERSATSGCSNWSWMTPASRNTLKMVHVNGLCRVRNSAQGTMLGGHQVAAVFCCKSICRLVTLIERCFRTGFCIFACMRFYVLVYATKFPAMDICYSAQRMRFLWPLCLFDVSFVSNRCACSVWCLLSARAKVLGWLVHILCMHSHAFWGVKRI